MVLIILITGELNLTSKRAIVAKQEERVQYLSTVSNFISFYLSELAYLERGVNKREREEPKEDVGEER